MMSRTFVEHGLRHNPRAFEDSCPVQVNLGGVWHRYCFIPKSIFIFHSPSYRSI
jgi:hypothetical protein